MAGLKGPTLHAFFPSLLDGAASPLITLHSDRVAEILDLVVVACWMGIFAILAIGKRRAAPGAQNSDRKSMLGMLLQLAGYMICFVALRPLFSPLFPISKTGEALIAAFTAIVAIASTWFCYAAAQALGRHWALMARVIEKHELIRTGPYSIVRNPIYLAMLGVVIATGLAFSCWQALVPAIVVYLIGTAIRIRAEEKLLRAAFAAEFDDYARRVPALLPLLYPPGVTFTKHRASHLLC
jgi:protein-S-isoprenylcysteine O-methyltransferase Ste14